MTKRVLTCLTYVLMTLTVCRMVGMPWWSDLPLDCADCGVIVFLWAVIFATAPAKAAKL